jgi:hypothetical protein
MADLRSTRSSPLIVFKVSPSQKFREQLALCRYPHRMTQMDVSLTDYGLAAGCAFFAYIFARKPKSAFSLCQFLRCSPAALHWRPRQM